MGNDYVPESKPEKSGGIISSLVSGLSSTILGDGTESTYQGNHGAGGSFRSNTSATGGGSYGGPSGGSSGTMTGLGNPNFRDAREEKSWVQKATEAAQSAMGSSSSSSGKAPAPGSSGYSDYNYATNRGANAYGGNDPAYNPRSTMNAFGSSSSADWQRGGVTNTPYGGTGAPSSAFGGSSVAAPVVGRAGGAASDGAYEKGLIDSLCEPGGLKAVPPENKLQEFLATATTLDADVVGNCLVDTLNSDQWQARVKALLVVASLIKAANNQAHADWWVANVNEVRALLNDSNSKVRLQAVKVVRALDGDAGSVDDTSVRSLSPKNTSYPTIASAGSNGQTTGSLLDDLDEPAPLSLNPVTAPAPAAQGVNLFGDVTFTTHHQQQPQPQPQYAAAVSSPLANNANSALFDGMSLGGGAPVAAPAAPYHLSSPAAYQPNASALSSMTVTPSMTPTTMGRPPNATNASAPAPPAPPAIDSAFDFLDSMSNGAAPPAPSVPVAPAPSIFDSFDNVPLTSTLAAQQAAPAPVAAPASTNGSAFSFLSSPSSTAPRSNPADLISTAFQESNQKKDANDSFAQLGASFGAPSSSSSGGHGYQQQQQQQQAPRPMGYSMNMNIAPTSNGYPGQVQGGYPPQPHMGGYAPAAGGFQQQQQQPPRGGVAPGAAGYGYNMSGNSVLAPSMLPHNAVRKAIPDATSAGKNHQSPLDFLTMMTCSIH